MQQLHTTSQVAELLGIPAATVRSWLSRYPEAFQLDIHIVQQEGKKLWTEAGLELLRQRAAENAAQSTANSDAIANQPAIDGIAINDAISNDDATPATFSDAMVNAFTDKISVELAATIAERLPSRILFHINRMLHTPSHQEREILQTATQQQLQLLPGIEKKYLALPQSK